MSEGADDGGTKVVRYHCHRCEDRTPHPVVPDTGEWERAGKVRHYNRTRECATCGRRIVTAEVAKPVLERLLQAASEVEELRESYDALVNALRQERLAQDVIAGVLDTDEDTEFPIDGD